MTDNFDLIQFAKESADAIKWMTEHPEFEQKPASIMEFLGPGYLNIYEQVRPGLRDVLRSLFGTTVGTDRISRYERAMMTGAIGIGKQLDPEEIVLTPAGWRQIQDLQIGDSVVGKDGLSHSVVNTTRWEDVERYRIQFKDGTWIDSGSEHLWTVFDSQDREITLSSEELFKTSKSYSIPLVDCVEFDKETLELDPYLMGQLLGDGCLMRTVTLASADLEIENYITLPSGVQMIRRADKNRWGFTTGTRGGNARVNPILTILRSYGLMNCDSYSKFIPEEYKLGSIKERIELLRGLMDSDGTVSETRGTRFASANKLLAEDVADLIRSLGGYASVSRSDHPNTRHGSYYEVSFWTSFCPFNLKRKSALWFGRTGRKPRRTITSVVKIENGPGVCISVDSKDHLYVTKDYIVTHNTTFASIVLPYLAHWVLCLKDPQKYFNLLPGSRIAFMMMSTSEQQAREVVFGDVFARINHSKWFQNNYPRDEKITRQVRFKAKDIWIIPGDSSETSFEGYNILGGILDEMDSHKQTKDKDYADVGYDAINSRIVSRFPDANNKGNLGLLICIGQMKKSEGFAATKYEEFTKDPDAFVSRMALWESLGWEKYVFTKGPDKGKRDSFWYDPKRKEIRPRKIMEVMGHTDGLIEVPTMFRNQFETNPQKALRDLAGIPPTVIDAFIALADRVEIASESWMDQHTSPEGIRSGSPVNESCLRPEFYDWFKANGDPRKRVMHIDLAVSGNGDALGMAMGHVSEMIVDSSGERKPYIVIDMLLRMKGAAGGQILLSDVRNIVYHLRDDLGFRLKQITMDGFNSTDTLQQLRKKKFFADYLSVDKKTLPYEDLRDAIYERRISWPPYFTYLKPGDTDTEHVLNRELLQLQDTGTKIDHPPRGSKDLADAVAGVVTTLMGDRTFHKGVVSRNEFDLTNPVLPEPTPTSAFEPAISRDMNILPKVDSPDFVPILTSGVQGLDAFHIELPGRRR